MGKLSILTRGPRKTTGLEGAAKKARGPAGAVLCSALPVPQVLMSAHPAPSLALLFTLILGCEPATVEPDRPPRATPSDDPQDQDTDDEQAEPPLAPVAVISGGDEVWIGEDTVLDGSASSDPQGAAILDYAWSCTDGSAASGAQASFHFAALGPVSCTLLVTADTGLTGAATVDFTVLRRPATWTVMVFVNGDNDLEQYAIEDLNEMEAAGSTDAVNLIVQIDRSEGYDRSEGNWTGARRYRMEHDDDMSSISSPVLEELGAVDSGRPSTIVAFVDWAARNYPADHYALVLWNHGWGWSFAPDDRPATSKGISWDQDTNNDISVAEGELEAVLAASTSLIGQKLDVIGFDACIMGSWEIAAAAAPYADVMVASQDYEDVDGWPYDTAMGDLVAAPTLSAAELGEHIAQRFNETKDSTQSAVDLGAMADLNAALDELALALINGDDPAGALALAAEALDFDGGRGSDHDLGDYLSVLATSTEDPAILAAVESVTTALDQAIIANYTYGRWASAAQGLSIYTPTRGAIDSEYLNASWSQAGLWDDFLSAARP